MSSNTFDWKEPIRETVLLPGQTILQSLVSRAVLPPLLSHVSSGYCRLQWENCTTSGPVVELEPEVG